LCFRGCARAFSFSGLLLFHRKVDYAPGGAERSDPRLPTPLGAPDTPRRPAPPFPVRARSRRARRPPAPPVARAVLAIMEGEDDGCGRGANPARLRWAVNTARWAPEGDHLGAEFQFLLTLIPPHERADCLKMVHMPDKKRALVSRLLQRQACANVMQMPHDSVLISRTKARKPFLANPRALPHAPNFNFNVSHEGDFVVLASEPHAICGRGASITPPLSTST
jgi:hypothetical protein